MGRYPFHWHMLSYSPADAAGMGGGVYLGDAVSGGHYLRNCSIAQSENRAVTVHGTCGVEVEETYAVDIKGHAFFFEDGSEQRNRVTDCVAMKVRSSGSNRLKHHDLEASGFWLTNPDNAISRNIGSDCDGRGLWNSFATRCFGLSRNAPINPNSLLIGLFEENVGHSNRMTGIVTEFPVQDEAGRVDVGVYRADEIVFALRRCQVWKNRGGGYQNRVWTPVYDGWTFADNNTIDAFGQSVAGSILRNALFVGSSLNNATPFSDPLRRAVASYNFSIDFVDLTFVNYPYVGPPAMNSHYTSYYSGGVFDGSDLYIGSPGMGHFRNSGWRLINSHPGRFSPSPYFDGQPISTPIGNRHWGLSGAVWDPHGYWGAAGNYLVPDEPFYTYGLSSSTALYPTGRSTPDLFYGLGGTWTGVASTFFAGSGPEGVRLERLDSNNNVIDEHTIGDFSTTIAQRFRHFGVLKGGRYRIVLLSGPSPSNYFNFTIENAWRPNDYLLVAAPWDGSVPVAGRLDSGFVTGTAAQGAAAGVTRVLSAVGSSISSVLADPTGQTMWQDSANNLVWIKHMGGLQLNEPTYDGRNEFSLGRRHQVRLYRQ
jgi:hypothetical protein